jgi:hypothetical protein
MIKDNFLSEAPEDPRALAAPMTCRDQKATVLAMPPGTKNISAFAAF